MPTDQIYRESQCQKHKLLGAYLVFRAWMRGVRCMMVPRSQLLKYLDLETMQPERLKWLKEDLKELFPHIEPMHDSDSGGYETLILSQREIPPDILAERMLDLFRIDRLEEEGIEASIEVIPYESEIIKKMDELSRGNSDFSYWNPPAYDYNWALCLPPTVKKGAR